MGESFAKNGNLATTPLSGAAIHQIVRRRATHTGYRPTALSKLGGHSLRAAFVTQGTRNGADGTATERQTGHARLDSVEAYRREHAPIVGNAIANIGLWQVIRPAFFTKWLYFLTARGNPTSPHAAPVLDSLSYVDASARWCSLR